MRSDVNETCAVQVLCSVAMRDASAEERGRHVVVGDEMSDFIQAERDFERWKNIKSRKMTPPIVAAGFTAAAVSIPLEFVFASKGMDTLLIGNWALGVAICIAVAVPVYWFFDWRICRQLRIEDDEQHKTQAHCNAGSAAPIRGGLDGLLCPGDHQNS